jgi:hypothetical protein
MELMSADFVRTLQNALVLRDDPNRSTNRSSVRESVDPDNFRRNTEKFSQKKTSNFNVLASDKDGYDCYINLFDFIKDRMKI